MICYLHRRRLHFLHSFPNLFYKVLFPACVDKYELEPEYISANGDWGVQDPVTGLWNGVVFQVFEFQPLKLSL